MGCAVYFWWRFVILAAISLATVNFVAAEPLPRSVLVINQSGPNRPWIVGFSTALRNILQADPSGPISLYIEDLDLTEFRSPEYEDSALEFLRVKYRNKSIGVVVSLGSLAYPYALHLRTKMWPGSQMVFSMMDEAMATRLVIPPGVTGTFMRLTLEDMVKAAQALVPGLSNVALVGDQLEKQSFYRHFAEELPGIAAKLQIIDLSGLPLKQVQRRVGELPDRTAILYTGIFVDGLGTSHIPADALTLIANAANRPVVVDVDSYMGRGAVGGFLLTAESAGEDTGKLVLRVLNGDSGSNIPIRSGGVVKPIFDWRQLQRWGIDEASLPPGSEIRFRELSVWEQYKFHILLAITLCVVEAVFIVILLAGRRRLNLEYVKRQQAELAARDLSGRLINAQEAERSRLARELHDDVTQRLALLAIDASRGENASTNSAGASAMRGIRDGLIHLSEDVHALSYRLHPSILEDLGLLEALRIECDQFSRVENVGINVKTEGLFDGLPGATALCLFRIVQEALRNVARHAKARAVQISLRHREDQLELMVSDDGAGFNPVQHRLRPSLGLASMVERVHLLDGKLHIESAPGIGTTIKAWLPLREELHEPATHLAG